ncbi:uncharacterized protein LOC119462094 [Dermacentor silvarum]|uniref:uncharacterized protein LOC119462094 n=1 Tax=Dermacentor silvarum TaxID=543639 RepID=UPI002101BE12|nr:uncharacterized protein LOC119462094 [Dermacentor silvarum]
MYKSYSSGRHCAVVGCTNNQRKRKLLMNEICADHQCNRGTCGCGVYSLHRFPAAPEKCREWEIALNRKDFKPSKLARVCSVHFVDGKPTALNPCPMLGLGYAKKVTRGRRPILRTLQPTSVAASVQLMDSQATHRDVPAVIVAPAPSPLSSTGYTGEQMQQNSAHPDECEISVLDLSCRGNASIQEERDYEKCHKSCQAETQVCSVGVQWEDPYSITQVEHSYAATETNFQCSGTQTIPRPVFEGLSEATCNFYTGLGLDGFWKLVTTVAQCGQVCGSMTIGDQLLLTLMRLRLGLLYFDLALRFGTSVARTGQIFRKMIGILDGIMRNVVAWLPIETILATMPRQFAESQYADTTCIIDCTEVHMQRPKKLYPRGQTYSAYKGCNTAKFLVAVAPSGFIMFVSNAYGGRASDKFIIEESGFVDNLSEGHVIMADRGFSLSNSMKEKGVKLNMPAFSRGKLQFTEGEATASRRISHLRIHVERAINRIKVYRILKYSLPIHHKKLMNSIILVCAGFCNLKGPLIADPKVEKDEEAESENELDHT